MALAALVLAVIAVVGLSAPLCWAQEQPASSSTQTAPAAAPDADNAPSSESDADPDPESMLPHFKSTRFWLSGQANFIFQAHPDFHAD
jgi:hypothetical protein